MRGLLTRTMAYVQHAVSAAVSSGATLLPFTATVNAGYVATAALWQMPANGNYLVRVGMRVSGTG